MNAVSLEPFKGKSDEEIAEECAKFRRDKSRPRPTEAKTPKATIDETLRRIDEQFTGKNAAVGQAERARRFEEHEREQRQRKAATLFLESNAPERQARRVQLSRDATGAKWAKALATIQGYSKNALIALIGPNGTGKTQLAVEMIRAGTARGESAKWTTATEFLMDIKSCYRDEAKTTERDMVLRYSKVDLLVIDEIHRRKGSEWEDSLLFDVIDRMYHREKMVIMIANQTQQEFEASMGSGLISRINENGGIINCKWESFRE